MLREVGDWRWLVMMLLMRWRDNSLSSEFTRKRESLWIVSTSTMSLGMFDLTLGGGIAKLGPRLSILATGEGISVEEILWTHSGLVVGYTLWLYGKAEASLNLLIS